MRNPTFLGVSALMLFMFSEYMTLAVGLLPMNDGWTFWQFFGLLPGAILVYVGFKLFKSKGWCPEVQRRVAGWSFVNIVIQSGFAVVLNAMS